MTRCQVSSEGWASRMLLKPFLRVMGPGAVPTLTPSTCTSTFSAATAAGEGLKVTVLSLPRLTAGGWMPETWTLRVMVAFWSLAEAEGATTRPEEIGRAHV